MRRGTTPTHEFALPFPVENVAEVELTYMQRDDDEEKIIFQKHLEDFKIDGDVLSYKFTEKESFMFEPKLPTFWQMRAVSPAGDVVSTDIVRISASDCISDKLLTEVAE